MAIEVLKSLSEATAEIVAHVSSSVVSVSCGMHRGTGILWSKDGHVVTCNHVIGRHDRVKVGTGEDAVYDAEVLGRDPYSDIALLKIQTEIADLKPIELGDSRAVKVGEFVMAIANPFNRSPAATSGMITSTGSQSTIHHSSPFSDRLVTDAPLNPGYSGGPLVDSSGRMIGMNAALAWSRGIAIPVGKVADVVSKLISSGEVRRGYLGIVVDTVDFPSEIAESEDLEQEGGVIVLSVERNSPARKAGLALGDVIVRFKGEKINSVDDLTTLLQEDTIGKENDLWILRGEKLLKTNVTPAVAGTDKDD